MNPHDGRGDQDPPPSQVANVLPGVYQLPLTLSVAEMGLLLTFLDKLTSYCNSELDRKGFKWTVPRGREGSLFERTETDLSFLCPLQRPPERFRLSGQIKFVRDNEMLCREVYAIITSLLGQFRRALEHIGVSDAKKLSYFAFSLAADPHTPAQPVHRDFWTTKPSKYFTFLLPVSEGAEKTEFVVHDGFASFPDIVMFHGNVEHRGPGTGAHHRLILSLVASKAKMDANHAWATPFQFGD